MFGLFATLRRLTAALTRTCDLIDTVNDRLTGTLDTEARPPLDVTPPPQLPAEPEPEPAAAGNGRRRK